MKQNYCHLALSLVWMLAQSISAAPPVTALALTPDGEHYMVGSQAGLAVVRLSDRKYVRPIATRLEQVHDIVYAPDGLSLLVVGGTPAVSGEAELFSWPDGQSKRLYKISDDLLYRVEWSSDSQTFATCGHDNSCALTHIDGKPIAKYTGHSRSVLTVRFMSENQRLLSAGSDQTIQLWSANGSRLRTLNNHTATVTDLAIKSSPKGSMERCASTSEDRSVRMWQPDIGRMVKFLRLESIPRRVAWRSDMRLVAATDDGMLWIIDADEMKVLHSVKTKISPIYELVLTSGGALVAGGGGVEAVHEP